MADELRPGFWTDVVAARRIAAKRGIELPKIASEPIDISKLKYGNTPSFRLMQIRAAQREQARLAGKYPG